MYRCAAIALLLSGCFLDRTGVGQPDQDAGSDAGAPTDAGSLDACPGATTETCNGVDDDCDDAIDEGCACETGETQACGSAVGACEQGVQTCVGGTFGPCEGGVSPTAEMCSAGALDEDCDGTVDEDCACVAGATELCAVGGCDALRTCATSGTWGDCTPTAMATEMCNGLDDDCDGTIDETPADCESATGCKLQRVSSGVYLFCDMDEPWVTAGETCAAIGYHLATIETTEENIALRDIAEPLDSRDWWIGFNDEDDDGTWTWLEGTSPLDLVNGGSDGECACIDVSESDWDGRSCTETRPYVCEAPPL